MQTIVVGYDDTPASQRALERAVELAKAYGAKLVVTSVAPVIASVGRSTGPMDPVDLPERHAQELAKAREQLEGLGVSADYQQAIGDVAPTIVEVARERKADLIIVGTRELNALMRAFGQSISDGVLHRADCDVMIVHATPPWTNSS